MNLPNKLVFIRIIISLVIIVLFGIENDLSLILILPLFLIGTATDMADGQIARRIDCVTDFGKVFDPIADKILVTSVFVGLSHLHVISSWVVSLIIIREFLVTGLRVLSSSEQKKILAAEVLGKIKFWFQTIFLTFSLIYLNMGLNENSGGLIVMETIIDILSYATVLITCISGFSYFYGSRKMWRNIKL